MLDNPDPFTQLLDFSRTDMPFIVELKPSGHRFSVDENEFVLDAALRAGINLAYACRDGKCGTCRCTRLAGTVDYPAGAPAALAKPEVGVDAVLPCVARAASDLRLEAAELSGPSDIKIKKLPCRIAHLDRLNHDVVRLRLKLPDSQRLRFLAGQYIDFLLKDGRRRSFSIANAPHDDTWLELHVRHVNGGEFTDFIFENPPEKALLRIEGPLGSFYLREDSRRPIIFMAGGTGFAPIKGIIEHAIASGITRPMYLYWGVRSLRDLYMDSLPRNWAAKNDHIHYLPVLSEPLPEDGWQGRKGYVHDAILEDFDDLSGFDIYAGGPPEMVNAGFRAFQSRGLTEEHYFSDAFEYSKDAKPED